MHNGLKLLITSLRIMSLKICIDFRANIETFQCHGNGCTNGTCEKSTFFTVLCEKILHDLIKCLRQFLGILQQINFVKSNSTVLKAIIKCEKNYKNTVVFTVKTEL